MIESQNLPQDRWYVVHTQPNAEGRAEINLGRQGFVTFVPRYVKTIRHARRFETRKAPLFARYLFVKLDPRRDRWRSIGGTFGVTSLLMDGDVPRPVPEGVVERLAATAREGDDFGGTVRSGDAVRLTAGPFFGETGVLVRMDPDRRVRVLLAIMGGIVPVEVAAASLMPA